MRLTLGSILAEQEFGLRLRRGGDEALARPVDGAEVVEVERPVELAARDHVLLTTGVRLRGRPDAQRQLARESQARGVTAIGFGVGLVFGSTPRALLETADECDLPVFEVPLEVPFRDIIGFVNRSLMSDDFYSLRRSVSHRDALLRAVGEPHPEQVLVTQLSTVVDGGVQLLGPDGAVAAQAGEVPEALVAEVVRRSGTGRAAATVDGWHVVVEPVVVAGELRYRLALTAAHPLVAAEVRPLLALAERVLRVTDVGREVAEREQRARRGALLAEMLDPVRAGEVAPARLDVFGFAPGSRLRALLVVSVPSAPHEGNGSGKDRVEAAPAAPAAPAETLRLLAVEMAATGRPHLLGPHGDHSAVLLDADDDQYQGWVGLLAAAGLAAGVGVGRPVEAPLAVRGSLIDAALAVDALARAGQRCGVLRFEDFSVADMLLCTADGAQLRARAEVLLAPLRDHPQLLEAVVAWFACDLNVNAAAARLHLHPNSLRYRLARVDEVTGRALHALPNLVDLYLALRSEARLPLEILQKAASTSSSPTVPRPGRRS